MLLRLDRTTLLRYLTVAAIFVALGGIFIQRELAGAGGAATIGLLDGADTAVGEPAPDFLLETEDGTIRLSDYRGQTVIVNFWASWCAPCRLEMPEFQALYDERLPDGDLTIIAVDFTASDTREAALAFVREIGITFPVAFDTPNSDVAARYGVRGLPATFFVDGNYALDSLLSWYAWRLVSSFLPSCFVFSSPCFQLIAEAFIQQRPPKLGLPVFLQPT